MASPCRSEENAATIKEQLAKVERLRTVGAAEIDLSRLNPNRVRHLAGVGRRMDPQAIARLEPMRRHQILAATVVETYTERIDEIDNFDELAACTNLDRTAVVSTIEANAVNRTQSIDRPAGNGSAGVASRLAVANNPEPEDHLDVMAFVRQLDERPRKIVYWHYFDDRTQRDIGSELGIGQVQVSRLLKSALRQLRSSAIEHQPIVTTYRGADTIQTNADRSNDESPRR